MAKYVDNLWKALDDLRDAPEDALDFDQIYEEYKRWENVRRQMEWENQVGCAANAISDDFYNAAIRENLTQEQLNKVVKDIGAYARTAIKAVTDPEPVGKHGAARQDKPDIRAFKYDTVTGFTEAKDDLDYETIVKGIVDLFK